MVCSLLLAVDSFTQIKYKVQINKLDLDFIFYLG